MPRRIRDFLLVLFVLLVAGSSGCDCGEGNFPDFGGGGSGGTGGEDLGPCGIDCSTLPTAPCQTAVCNTGQEVGPVGFCVVVPSTKGTPCDDGLFCTDGDTCDAGVCVGGPTNDCGLPLSPCDSVICYESTQTCSAAPVNDGTACTPEDPCKVNGVCQTGVCIGEPKDCSFSPLAECNLVSCDPATGACVGTPDPNKNNDPCVLTGDLCRVGKTCQAGQCVGGEPKDCSTFDVACEVGTCNPTTGICGPLSAPAGTPCAEGLTECRVGECDGSGLCKSSLASDGTSCNDHDACTAVDSCVTGLCSGATAVPGCTLYFKHDFESCAGWSLGGDWECGPPAGVGPPAAHNGLGVLATKVAGVYSANQSYTTAVADSPPIDLTSATNPMLSFWAWDHTEGGTFDGWNLKVSVNGGASFTQVTGVAPAYALTIQGQPAWGGNNATLGWRNYQADLTPYAGQTVILRFAFRSDAAGVFPGAYIDDLFVAEPLQNPLYITTASLPDVYAGMPYSIPMQRNGGTAGASWSIVPGGVNTAWLTIDPATGELSGTPAGANAGPVSVTIRVEEPLLPTNYDQRTYEFDVDYAAYYTSFEGACPAGWTLSGTWECGVPTTVGPPSAYAGAQAIGTRIAANYLNSQSFSTATASSPNIDLSSSPIPTLTFRMWVHTEGGVFDGANLKISTDGGGSWSVVDTVTPPYPLMIDGEPAWGGQQQGLGWQYVEVNLAQYTGQIVRLQFSFRSDSSGNHPGIYIDDFLVQ